MSASLVGITNACFYTLLQGKRMFSMNQRTLAESLGHEESLALRFQGFSVAPMISSECHVLGNSILYSTNEDTKTSREPLSLPGAYKRQRLQLGETE